MNPVEAPGSGGLGLWKALAPVLLAPGWSVPAGGVRRPQRTGLELNATHDGRARVVPVVLVAPLWLYHVPLVSPFLSQNQDDRI